MQAIRIISVVTSYADGDVMAEPRDIMDEEQRWPQHGQ